MFITLHIMISILLVFMVDTYGKMIAESAKVQGYKIREDKKDFSYYFLMAIILSLFFVPFLNCAIAFMIFSIKRDSIFEILTNDRKFYR